MGFVMKYIQFESRKMEKGLLFYLMLNGISIYHPNF